MKKQQELVLLKKILNICFIVLNILITKDRNNATFEGIAI